MRRQSHFKHGYGRIDARVKVQIRNRIESLANHADCSYAFVVNTILADALGIPLQERYNDNQPRKIRKIS